MPFDRTHPESVRDENQENEKKDRGDDLAVWHRPRDPKTPDVNLGKILHRHPRYSSNRPR
jgi:hypothetical protein